MSGLGGLNKAPDGVVIGLVQLQLPTIAAFISTAARKATTTGMSPSAGICTRPQQSAPSSRRLWTWRRKR